MRGDSRRHLFIEFLSPALLYCANALEFFLCARNLLVGDLAAFFLFGAFARFSFDSLPLLPGAAASDFFFILAPSFLFNPQCIFSREPFSFEFRATGFFFRAQPAELFFQLTDLFSRAVGYGLFLRG